MDGWFSECDQHVLGEKVIAFRVDQGGLGYGVEDDDLVFDVEIRQILADGNADAVRIMAEVVDGRDASVGERDRAANLATQVGCAGLRPGASFVVG